MSHTIDGHVHISSVDEIEGFLSYMEQTGIVKVNCATIALATRADSPRGIHSNMVSLAFKCRYPEKVFVFGGLEYPPRPSDVSAAEPRAQAEALVAMGCDGIKMLEGKPDTRKYTGLPVCDPVYNEYYDYLQQTGIPLLFHVNDPEEFWDEERVPAWARERGWYWGDGTYPTKEQLYSEVDTVLRNFPRLNVTFPHFYFLSADPDRAARFLDRWRNVRFDLTPGREMYLNFAKDPSRWHSFFTRYQDRIVFGTDTTASGADRVTHCVERVGNMRTFLETTDTCWAGQSVGIGLDPDVCTKIYAGNFVQWVGRERPVPPAVARIRDACEERIERLNKGEGSRLANDEVRKVLGLLGE